MRLLPGPFRTAARGRHAGLTAALAACAALTLVVSGTAVAADHIPATRQQQVDRGRLVSAVHLTSLSASSVATELSTAGFDAGTVHYGVDTYRLVYQTVDPAGRGIVASGLLALPRGPRGALPVVSFTHGTEIDKRDAPSVTDDGFELSPPLGFASAGFATAAPDYLGLGVGPGPHPWMDVPTETTASLDMLRAAHQFAPQVHERLARTVFVSGFSQGASAAMSLARALQDHADHWFRLAALAPISGAYDFQHAEIPAMLAGQLNEQDSVVYVAYLFVAWDRLHHLYDSPREVFREPYARRVDRLFDGITPAQLVVRALPHTLDALLTTHGLAMLRHPTGPFAAALRVADGTCDWTPTVPTRLYLAHGDEQAANANSYHCQQSLRARHVSAPVVDLGTPEYQDSRHLGSNVAGTAAAIRWFLAQQ